MDITLPDNFKKPIVKGPINGNAFYILGVASKALRSDKVGLEKSSVDAIIAEAMDGDYNHLLRTLMQYVEFDI